MSEILILAGAVTNATRLEKRLHSQGDINARAISTPTELGKSGCSYSVIASLKSEGFVRSVAKAYRIKAIYLIENIFGKRSYRDIS